MYEKEYDCGACILVEVLEYKVHYIYWFLGKI